MDALHALLSLVVATLALVSIVLLDLYVNQKRTTEQLRAEKQMRIAVRQRESEGLWGRSRN